MQLFKHLKKEKNNKEARKEEKKKKGLKQNIVTHIFQDPPPKYNMTKNLTLIPIVEIYDTLMYR